MASQHGASSNPWAPLAEFDSLWLGTRATPEAMLYLMERMVLEGVPLDGPYGVQAAVVTEFRQIGGRTDRLNSRVWLAAVLVLFPSIRC